jgi:N-acetylglucosaminyldiphosphoundecaprenol N-acetyl-beta-D-mannosaminyltransferase
MKKNDEKGRKYVTILGIKVNSTTLTEVLTRVEEKITHSEPFYIVTPNPELVLMAQKNIQLRESLNSADFAIPDGVGLKYASKFLNGKNLNIIPGRKLFLELVKLANEKHWKVFLLGGLDNEAEIVAKKFGFQYAGGAEVTTSLSKDIVDRINKYSPDLMFLAFGNPKQEIFIHQNIGKLNVKGMMAVGGTFRYVAGLSKLPPKWMEKMGLEWLFRLLSEPFRFKRIWNAVIVFPWKVFLFKIS